MSATTTPSDSPASIHIEPLHNPQNAAHVTVPQALLGNATTNGPGMGTRAFLARRLTKTQNPTYVSPTDNMMTPVTQKISAAKKKRFNAGKTAPISLFGDTTASTSDDDDGDAIPPASSGTSSDLVATDDNPF